MVNTNPGGTKWYSDEKEISLLSQATVLHFLSLEETAVTNVSFQKSSMHMHAYI